MAALIGNTKYGLDDISTSVTVPNTPTARLMFYFNCVTTVLDMNDESNMSKLRDYRNYGRLTEDEVDALVALCFLLSPDTLAGKVFFVDDDMCGDRSNAFYELSAVRTSMLLSQSILIGGRSRTVKKIMFFKKIFLEMNWVNPMQHFSLRLARMATGAPRSRPAIEYSRPTRAVAPSASQSVAPSSRPAPSSSQSVAPSNNDDGCCCTIL